MLKPVGRTTVVDAVIEQLVALIRDGTLAPGERVPGELELSSQLGVGRTSIREALKALEYIGLIERDHEGTVVSSVALLNILQRVLKTGLLTTSLTWGELFEARRALEGEIAALAATRIEDGALANLEQQCSAMEELGTNYSRFFELDMEFHHAICGVAHNPLLTSMWRAIHELLEFRRADILDSPNIISRSNQNHRDVLAALRTRDPATARSAVQNALNVTESLISAAFKKEAEDD